MAVKTKGKAGKARKTGKKAAKNRTKKMAKKASRKVARKAAKPAKARAAQPRKPVAKPAPPVGPTQAAAPAAEGATSVPGKPV